MSAPLKAPLWTRLILLLPFLFVGWSVCLFVFVNNRQAEVTNGTIVLIGNLLAVVSCLLAIGTALLLRRFDGDRRTRARTQLALSKERDFSNAVIETIESLVIVLDR